MTCGDRNSALGAWLDNGLTAHRAGDLDRAASMYSQALLAAPGNPDALNLLGTALLQMGRADEGRPHLEEAARKLRRNPQLLANLAQCYMALGRHDDAAEAFRKAGRIDPREIHFQLGLSSALALGGKLGDAQAVLERAAKRAPTSAAIWLNLGNVARDQQRRQDAIDLFNKAVALDPSMPEAHNNLGSALHAKLRFADAEKEYRECIRLAPDYLIGHFNLASVLMDLGRFAESETVARELVARAPDAPEPHGLLASALGLQSRLLEAHASYARAYDIAPHAAKTCETLAMSFMEIGRIQQGLRMFAKATELGADRNTTRQLVASALLADGALHDGLSDYRARPYALVFREKNPDVPIVQNALGDVRDKHVCVLGEQGLGDELFFLRYVEALAQAGARITYRAGAKIASLVSRLPCIAEVTTADEPLPAADAYMLVADVPLALSEYAASDLSKLPASERCMCEFERNISIYVPPVPRSVRVDPLASRLQVVQARLAEAGPPPYIGLTWRAGTLPEEQRAANWLLYKTIALPTLAAAVDGVSGTLLALQRAPADEELARASQLIGRAVHDFSAMNDDLEQMLALLAEIDEYIGVSNTNMHLRAAAGRTARVLVPAPAEWRWMRAGRESPWFPGFTIYRQSLQGDWTAAMTRLKSDLLHGNRSPARHSIPS